MVTGFPLLSRVMYRFACHAALLAERDPFTPKVAFPIAAVLHAASSLEAFLNEELEQRCTLEPHWKPSIQAIERVEFQNRWFVVPQLLFNRTFDKDAEPFQSFRALVKLRNELVHYKPVTRSFDFLPAFARDLESRFQFSVPEAIPGFPPMQASWDQKIWNRVRAMGVPDGSRDGSRLARTCRSGQKAVAAWEWSLAYLMETHGVNRRRRFSPFP